MIRGTLSIIEITILSILILATRCANYQDVFVGGNIYFTDADCYARMTRVRMCSEHPGLIVRHHAFQNFPAGTTPHTTAPLDYLILALSMLLKPFTAHSLDLAGALISPSLAVIGGWFLWWWSAKFPHPWITLIVYAISPILVHGMELGRPDHRSLPMLLVTVAICAEWSLQAETSAVSATDRSKWSIVSGIAWGLAIWTSAYESLVLLLLVLVASGLKNPKTISARSRRCGSVSLIVVILIALLIERRIPVILHLVFGLPVPKLGAHNWGNGIYLAGESDLVALVRLFVLPTPFLIWLSVIKTRHQSNEVTPTFVLALFVATYLLTIWQARWGYFFCTNPCSSDAVFARADQIANGSLDRIFLIDPSDVARLGRKTLAQ